MAAVTGGDDTAFFTKVKNKGWFRPNSKSPVSRGDSLKHMSMKKNRQAKMAPKESSRPQKVLLHVALQDGSWRGKAVSFDRKEEFVFCSFAELASWLENNITHDIDRSAL